MHNYPFATQGIYAIHSPLNHNQMKKPTKQPSTIDKTVDRIKTLQDTIDVQKDTIAQLNGQLTIKQSWIARVEGMLAQEKRRTEEVAMRLSWTQDALTELKGKWYVKLMGR